ncbi:MAG: OB-fold nucleic acid binding domain-containing protein [Christensenellaceae bacterium]|nr:OB-fold nucleic acid binding domain-containing protein [Christensenellaceae bacterium]
MASEELKLINLKIRSLDERLKYAKISKVELYPEPRSARVTVICNNTVSEDLRARILASLETEFPPSFKQIALDVKRIRADEELVAREIFSYLKENCKSVAHSVLKEDIKVKMTPITCDKDGLSENDGEISTSASDKSGVSPRAKKTHFRDGINDLSEINVVSFNVAVDKDMVSQFESHGTIREIENYLGRFFCDEFRGSITPKDTEVDFSILDEKPPVLEYVKYRSIKVTELNKLDDLIGADTAVYIDDVQGEMDSVFLCGTILSIRERVTVKGKPFFLIEFTDKSGKITGTYFNKKSTEGNIRKLKEGDGIFIQGAIENYRDRLSLVIKKINYCRFPENFIPEQKPSKSTPQEYKYIFPEKIVDYTQGNMLKSESRPPECLMGKTFVVFDTETTGTEPATDTVTEIGAVKIVNGVITERFGSLINPKVKIKPEITDITGITDAMVADKPVFKQVAGDVYKFFEGAILIAHNIDFDIKFLKRLSAEAGYYYYNKLIDTLALARQLLPRLHNHKLGTIAEYFGIEFNPHRAYDDAHATAKVFIKLIEMKGCLPDLT